MRLQIRPHRRRRLRPFGLARPRLCQGRHDGRAGRALGRQARRVRQGDRRQGVQLRCRQARRGRKAVRRSRRRASSRPMSSSIMPATARAGRSSSSIRSKSPRRSRSPPSAPSWSARRRPSACCRAKRGAILFTGASASVKGYAQSAPFAMGKFALRGLAQSMARELGPQGIHVAHFVIDGGIRSARRPGVARCAGFAARSRRHRRELSRRAASSRAAPGRRRSSCGRGWRSSEFRSHPGERAEGARLEGEPAIGLLPRWGCPRLSRRPLRGLHRIGLSAPASRSRYPS